MYSWEYLRLLIIISWYDTISNDRVRGLIAEAGFVLYMSDSGVVTEAKPPVEWNKGNAAIYILKTAFGIHWSDNVRVIYAGDDQTDEDAMKALKVFMKVIPHIR